MSEAGNHVECFTFFFRKLTFENYPRVVWIKLWEKPSVETGIVVYLRLSSYAYFLGKKPTP